MASRAETNRPGREDKVWNRHRYDAGKQPNGVIYRIDWQWKTVSVIYWDDDIEEFDLSDFSDNFRIIFNPRHQGTWEVGGKHPLIEKESYDGDKYATESSGPKEEWS